MSVQIGDKYIIEIGAIAEMPDGKKKYFIKPFESLVFDRKGLEQLEKLEKATGNIYQTGYDKGFEDGKADVIYNPELIDELKQVEYIRGLEDAWKLARKIEMLTCGEVKEIFGEKALTQFGDEEPSVFAILNQFTYWESESKFKAYEDKKKAEEKIKVGDIVYYGEEMLKAIVLDIDTEQGVSYAIMLDENGLNINEELSGLKFIEHTNEVEQLLDKLRGEEE